MLRKRTYEVRAVVCYNMVGYTIQNDPVIEENIYDMRSCRFWRADSSCHLCVSSRHYYNEYFSVLRLRKMDDDIDFDKSEGSWCRTKLHVLFSFTPVRTTQACGTVPYHFIDVFCDVRPEEFYPHCFVHAPLTQVSRNWCIMLCIENVPLSDTPTRFCRQPSIIVVRTERPSLSTWESDPWIPICVIASRQSVYFVCSGVNSLIVGTSPFLCLHFFDCIVLTLVFSFVWWSVCRAHLYQVDNSVASRANLQIRSLVALHLYVSDVEYRWFVNQIDLFSPPLGNLDSSSVAWYFTRPRLGTSNWNSENYRRHSASLLHLWDSLSIRFWESWAFLSVDRVRPRYCRKRRTAHRTARHSRCVVWYTRLALVDERD